MDEAQLKFLTMKMLSLTVFVTAGKVSELHELSTKEGHCIHTNEGKTLTLLADASFVAKNQLMSDPPRKFQPHALKEGTGADKTLCPVRALKWYVRRTKAIRGPCTLIYPSSYGIHSHTSMTRTHGLWTAERALYL